MEQNTELEIILALLKYTELHVRHMAKIINEPHANVSRVMKKLLNNSIVDVKFEGKNKVFRLKKGIEALNYVYIAEHYKLLKLFKTYPSLSVIAEGLLSKTDEKLIILFGSYAKFTAKRDSDIDIYIETTKRSVRSEIEGISSKLSVKIGTFDKNNLLIKEIIKDHVVIRGVEYFYEKNRIFD